MRSVVAVFMLVAAMLAGAFSIHNIWEGLSLLSEGRAGDVNLQMVLLSFLLLATVIGIAAKVVDWVIDSQPRGGR